MIVTLKEKISECYLIPVVVMDDAQKAIDTAHALLAGGVNVMEITLRTEDGLKAIEHAANSCPQIITGAGTVLSLDKCKEAISRGASFIVSPGFDPEIVEYCVKNNVPIFPGCVTPTEITAARKAGIDVVKFFPAQVYGGISAIKAISAPFSGIKFIPTGGVDNDNLTQYIIPQVFAIGGAWLCERKHINNGDFKAITTACETAVNIVKRVRVG
jgi:2-dehydro-3-deoxyphosphogluconate aldolase/(4S)-4-hydroxy-2-oxoglutarate aldolase